MSPLTTGVDSTVGGALNVHFAAPVATSKHMTRPFWPGLNSSPPATAGDSAL